MGSNVVGNTLSLLAGASLGAIATYLLDPDQGDQRRSGLVSGASSAAAGTSEAVQGSLHQAADAAKSIASKLSAFAEHAIGHVSDHVNQASDLAQRKGEDVAGDLSSRAKAAASQLQAHYDDLTDRANSMYSSAKRSALRQAGVPESHPISTIAGISVGAIGVAALGAGAMYFFDPAKGRARRAWAQDKATSFTKGTGKSARQYGRHLGNQLKGYAHDVKSSLPENWAPTIDKVVDKVVEKTNAAADGGAAATTTHTAQ